LQHLATIDESYPALFASLPSNKTAQIKVNNEREESLVNVRVSHLKTAKGNIKVATLHNIGSELETREIDSWVKLIRVMTHEIMNSVAPISSLSEALLYEWQKADIDTPLRNGTIEACQTIHGTAMGLLHFVESYRKFTGVPKPKLEALDVRPMIEDAVTLETADAHQIGVAIRTQLSAKPLIVQADKAQIMRVLLNLLKNAVEAFPSEARKPEITVYALQRSMNVVIEVCDNGRPIPADAVSDIFVPFFTTKEGGSGIGLSVSRYIMRLHGGNLHYHLVNGQTAFSVEFPIHA
jgi:nitrogen fixation/metabolism regulation signal transduction histidine kinase